MGCQISLGCIPRQRDFLPAIGRLYKPFAFYVRMLFSFDVQISSCFPFSFLKLITWLFLSLKADKRNLVRNTIPEDICWESRDDVERLTNKQLRLYLRQEGLMVSGNKARLVERILKHAYGSVVRTFDEDIEDNDENMLSSSHDDTSSDSEEESTEYEGGSLGDDYVKRSFQVLFIDDADIPEVV